MKPKLGENQIIREEGSNSPDAAFCKMSVRLGICSKLHNYAWLLTVINYNPCQNTAFKLASTWATESELSRRRRSQILERGREIWEIIRLIYLENFTPDEISSLHQYFKHILITLRIGQTYSIPNDWFTWSFVEERQMKRRVLRILQRWNFTTIEWYAKWVWVIIMNWWIESFPFIAFQEMRLC